MQCRVRDISKKYIHTSTDSKEFLQGLVWNVFQSLEMKLKVYRRSCKPWGKGGGGGGYLNNNFLVGMCH